MNILYVTNFFPPENIAAAFRSYEHARYWVGEGHEVTILTGWPNYPRGRIFEGYHVEMLREEECDGLRILRSKIIAKPNTSFYRRVVNATSFMVYGYINSIVGKKKLGTSFDVVIASSGPIFAGMLGRALARRLGLPFVVEYRDITFEQMVATGSHRRALRTRLMRRAEVGLAQHADGVIVLTRGFRTLLEAQGVPSSKISVVENGADLCEQAEPESGRGLRFGYFGTLGISQDIPGMLDFFRDLTDSIGDFSLTIIGEGACREQAVQKLRDPSYRFATLLPGMSQEELEDYYRDQDMTIVSLVDSESFRHTIPSKMLQSFARGVPVLFFGPDGEASRIITENEAGLVCRGSFEEKREVLADFFSRDDWREEMSRMSQNARALIAREFSRKQKALDALAALELVVNNWNDARK